MEKSLPLLGSLLAIIGYGMTLTNWLAIFIPALCLGGANAYRIHVEFFSFMRLLWPGTRMRAA